MTSNLKYRIFYSYFGYDQYGVPKSKISRVMTVTAMSADLAIKIIEDKHLGYDVELEDIIECE